MKSPKKKILFRVDAGEKIGLGHYYRSMNLALFLKQRGHELIFMHLPSKFWNDNTNAGFRYYVLKEDDTEKEMLKICHETDPDIFYVDGIISFSERFIHQVKKRAKVVFYQNLSDSKCFADLFFLPSIYQKKDFFAPFIRSNTIVYQGLEYLMFNKKIGQEKQKVFTPQSGIKRIAVTAGGSDPKNMILSLYGMIENTDILENLSVTFFFGTDYMFKDLIPGNFEKGIEFKPYNIKDILLHDMLIAAFGVSAYEFMYLGIPVVGIGHQESNAIALKSVAEKTKGIYDLGLLDDISREYFLRTLNHLIQHPEMLAIQVNNARRYLDLNGIQRVTSILEELP